MYSSKKWIWLRRFRITVQWLSLILFTIFLAYSPLAELFFRLNPFAGLSASIAGRSILIYFWPSLFIILITVFLGRVWCGWLCPLGTVIDIFGFKKKKKIKKIPATITWFTHTLIRQHDQHLRKIKYFLLIIILIAALFGNLTLFILEPITIITRTFTVSIFPAINHIITEIELFLYDFDFLYDILDTIDSVIRGTLIPFKQSFFIQNIVFLLVFAGIILLNLLAHRFWCRYLCPFGAFLAFISKFSLFKRQVTKECSYCTACHHTCNMDAIHSENNNKSDQSECTVCLDCFTQCPPNGLYISSGKEKEPVKGISLSRKEFLISAGCAVFGVSLLKGDIAGIKPDKHLIRPPGVTDEAEFLSGCIRCGQCIQVCPTSGLQPSLFGAGPGGLWTPRLVSRLGACDYTCNLCGQVCPTGAIPKLALTVKQKSPLGKATINIGRCLEWADNAECLICEEFCPLPEKAVERRIRIETDREGNRILAHGPVVSPLRCIGCGICENLCPLMGEAAIRVTRIVLNSS